MTYDEEITRTAQQMADILTRQVDPVFATKLDDLKEVYSEGIYSGNWDVTTDFEDGTRNLQFIQEDEFDQHRTDDMPKWDDIIAEGPSVYVFWA